MEEIFGVIVMLFIVGWILVAILGLIMEYYVHILIGLLICGVLYGLYFFFWDNVKKTLKLWFQHLQTKIANYFLAKKIRKQKRVSEDKARSEAVIEATKLFEGTISRIEEEGLLQEVEKLRLEAENKIFTAKIQEGKKLSEKYEEAIKEIEEMKNLTENDKLRLYKKLINVSK